MQDSNYEIIAKWEYFGILTLLDTLTPNGASINDISKKLDLSAERVEEILDRLKQKKLAMRNNMGLYVPVNPILRTTEDIPSQALVDSHIETLDIGKDKLQNVELDYRDFSSIMIPTNLSKIPEAKVIIREFRQKMAALLERGDKTDVFQLAIQLYPLSKIQQEGNLND